MLSVSPGVAIEGMHYAGDVSERAVKVDAYDERNVEQQKRKQPWHVEYVCDSGMYIGDVLGGVPRGAKVFVVAAGVVVAILEATKRPMMSQCAT